MKVANLFTMNPWNVGDMASSPAIYFPLDAERVSTIEPVRQIDAEVIIAGGGGLLHADMLLPWMNANRHAKWVSWGIGHNTHGGSGVEWPVWMNEFALHGVRDWPNPWHWVPCASCWHPALDREYEMTSDIVVYDHAEFPTGVQGFPLATNSLKTAADAIAFLGSGETVITSSYHGAYWAALLGRKVIVVRPFSTKFSSFRHPPAQSADWRDARPVTYPEALYECREANARHWRRVQGLCGMGA